jgi:PAS domain S-box-containing protein
MQQESFFKTTLYSIGDAVIITDVKGRIQQMNPVAEKLCGWKESDAKNKSLEVVFNIINEVTKKKSENIVKKVLKKGHTIGLANHTILISKSKKQIPIADSSAPIKNDDGKVIGVIIVFRDQTAEREKQNALEDRERKYSTLVSNLPGFIYRCANDKNWTMEFISDGCKKVTGYSPNDFIKNNKLAFNDVIHPDFQEQIWKKWQKLLKEKRVFEFEYPIITKNGKLKWVWERGRGVYSESGKLLFLEGFIEDISKRRSAEEMFNESEQRYKSFFDNSPDAIFLADPETGKIIDANQAAINLIKLPYSKVIGIHQKQLHPKRLESYTINGFDEHKKISELKIPIENFVVTSEGEEIPVEILASKLNIKGRTVIQGVFRNISERRKIEEALQESENKFQLFFEHSKDAMLLLDGEVFFDCNKEALHMLGYSSKEEMLSLHPAKLSPEFQLDGLSSFIKAENIMSRAFKEGFMRFEWMHRKKNGEDFPVEVMLTAIPLAGKQILFTVWRDITERKSIELELQRSRDRMQVLVEGTPHLFFYMQNLDGKIEYISPSVESITGYSVAEWHNQNNWFLTDSPINKDARKRTWEHLSGVINTNPVYAEILHANGSKVMIEVYERPIIKDGKVLGLHGVAHDITERLRFEENLKESEISYRGLFNSVSEAIYILDENGVFIDINPGALAMYGYERNELIGKTPEFVSAPNKNDLNSVAAALGKAFEGEKQQFEFWGKRKNGEAFLKDIRLYLGTYLNKKVCIAIANDITEKRKIENALALSEERYRAISNLTSDYLFSTEADENGVHKLTWIAGSFEKITGYTFEEYQKVGGWRAKLHPDELELDDLDLEKLKKNQKINREIKTFHKNGSLVWVRSSAQPIWDKKNNKLTGVYGAVEEITLRKQAEIIQKVQYSIADAAVTYKTLTELFENIRIELSAIINVNNFFIALYDEKTGMLRSDVDKDEMEEIPEWPAKGSMSGYVIEQNKSVLLTKDDINKLISNGEAGMIGVIPEIWLGVPFKIGGAVFGVLVVQSYDNPNAYDQKSIEILEIVAHELSIFIKHSKAEEETLKLSTAIIQSPTIVVITDPNGNIEYVNPKFTEVTGYTLEEAKWKNPKLLNSGFHDKLFFTVLWKTILSGKIWQGEFKNKKKNGELYWENALISPIKDSDGKIIHFVAVKEDITEKKKMIEELIVAKEKAEEMNRIKSSFFANMSHELRTPMVGILGFSEVLMNELKDFPNYVAMISSINVSGQRLLETLNLILNLSKLEASKVEVNLKAQNIIPILKESFGFFESAAAKKTIDYTFVSEHSEIVCNIDQLLFSSIFNNLLNNAIKFTDSGSVTLIVSTDSENATISVSDTGVGISEAKQNLIWEEFRQASEGYNRGFEGTGLGLTIAKKYTDLMQGSVSVKSSLGNGTTFVVSFPLTNKNSKFVNPTNNNDSEDIILSTEINPSVRILYVEDDEISVKYVTTITKSLYNIDAAKDSDEALNKIKEHKYDAILMDINLRRGMDGLELTKVIRKVDGYKSTPIVAITAFAMGREKEEFLAKGMTHYLSKPFVKNQLLNLLASIVENK